MEKAKELIELYPRTANGRILWIDEVTKAKGRFDRVWLAKKGGLWLVLTLYDDLLPASYGLLSLAIGLALVRTVHDLGAKEVRLKWINDLHYRGKKIAGVLTEKWKDWLITGIGLNVNNSLPPSLPAENLQNLLGQPLSLFPILELLIFWLNFYYSELQNWERQHLEEYPRKENCENSLRKDFKIFSDTLGKCVYYSYNLEEKEGIIGKVIDLSEKGALLLDTGEVFLELKEGEIIYLF